MNGKYLSMVIVWSLHSPLRSLEHHFEFCPTTAFGRAANELASDHKNYARKKFFHETFETRAQMQTLQVSFMNIICLDEWKCDIRRDVKFHRWLFMCRDVLQFFLRKIKTSEDDRVQWTWDMWQIRLWLRLTSDRWIVFHVKHGFEMCEIWSR